MKLIKKSKEILQRNIFKRSFYLRKIRNFLTKNNVLVISGQRRTWKSFIINAFLKYEKINLNNVFYLNKELDIWNEIKNALDLEDLFQNFLKQNPKCEYIIIDEIQDIENWENFIRAKYAEKKYFIIITWSNSKLLSWELASYLTWRFVDIKVFPLSYQEYLEFKKFKNNKKAFFEYLEFGGLPEVVLENNLELKKNYIKNLKDSIILKDIVARYNIKNYSYFEKILQFLSNNIWAITSLRKIENYFIKDKIKISLTTISNYLKYLENSFLINECEKIDLNWKKILEYNSKYYFNDLWIRNSINYNFNFDIWKLLENYIFNILIKNWYKVFVWNKKWLEIDFVAEKDWKRKYFQVAYLISDEKVYEREFWNLKKINDNWDKYVLSMDDIKFNDENGIKHLNILNFEEINLS